MNIGAGTKTPKTKPEIRTQCHSALFWTSSNTAWAKHLHSESETTTCARLAANRWSAYEAAALAAAGPERADAPEELPPAPPPPPPPGAKGTPAKQFRPSAAEEAETAKTAEEQSAQRRHVPLILQSGAEEPQEVKRVPESRAGGTVGAEGAPGSKPASISELKDLEQLASLVGAEGMRDEEQEISEQQVSQN